MIGCLRTRVRKQPIITFYFESENELKFYNLNARTSGGTHYVSIGRDVPMKGAYFQSLSRKGLCCNA